MVKICHPLTCCVRCSHGPVSPGARAATIPDCPAMPIHPAGWGPDLSPEDPPAVTAGSLAVSLCRSRVGGEKCRCSWTRTWRPTGHSPTGHSPTAHSPTGHSPTAHSPTGHSPMGHSTGPEEVVLLINAFERQRGGGFSPPLLHSPNSPSGSSSQGWGRLKSGARDRTLVSCRGPSPRPSSSASPAH